MQGLTRSPVHNARTDPFTDNPLEAVRQAMAPSAVLFAGFEPADEDPVGVLVSYLQETIDLPGDVILVYNAGDVSLEA